MTNENIDNKELIKQIEEYQELDITMKVGHCPECNYTFLTSLDLNTEEEIVCPNCMKIVKLTENDIYTLQDFKNLLQES
jgi:rubrerythrin